jgi:hypothetical protein
LTFTSSARAIATICWIAIEYVPRSRVTSMSRLSFGQRLARQRFIRRQRIEPSTSAATEEQVLRTDRFGTRFTSW